MRQVHPLTDAHTAGVIHSLREIKAPRPRGLAGSDPRALFTLTALTHLTVAVSIFERVNSAAAELRTSRMLQRGA
jgi:hypothetical protein